MTLTQLIEQGNNAVQESNWEVAYDCWDQVYEQDPNHRWAGTMLGLVLFELNRLKEAEEFLIKSREEYPDQPLAYIYLAKIAQKQDQWDKTVEQWGTIATKFPTYEWAFQSYASSLKKTGNLNTSERYYHMDIAQHPKHVWSHRQLIQIAIEKHQFDLANRRFDKFLTLFPNNTKAHEEIRTELQTSHNNVDLTDYISTHTPEYLKIYFQSTTQQKFMYTVLPKVAGTTIIARLYKQLLGKNPPRRVPRAKIVARFADENSHNFDIEDCFTFTVVRNPYSRILSAYLDKIQKPYHAPKFRTPLGLSLDADITFCDFLYCLRDVPIHQVDVHFRPQWHLLSLNKSFKYDFIGRFENLETDIEFILRRIGGNKVEDTNAISRRPHATNANEKLKQYYTPEEQALVAEIYQDDFKYLGYGYDLNLA